jgi:hypothetical protein
MPAKITTDESLVPLTIQLPQAMVSTAYVVRKIVEMRVGPGTQFKLKDSLASQGDRVVLLERSGSWQKVVLPEKSEAGWVHRATLGRIELNTTPITLKCELLPRVFATRKLTRVFPYRKGTEREISADIAKGESFIAVRYRSNRVLVYLPVTNSVVWLDGGIVE